MKLKLLIGFGILKYLLELNAGVLKLRKFLLNGVVDGKQKLGFLRTLWIWVGKSLCFGGD